MVSGTASHHDIAFPKPCKELECNVNRVGVAGVLVIYLVFKHPTFIIPPSRMIFAEIFFLGTSLL